MHIVHEDDIIIDEIPQPYIPTFLGFREVPAFQQLIQKSPIAADVYIVDGFGILHPRRCGSASHLGVVQDIVTIGVAKSLLHTDGLDTKTIRQRIAAENGGNEGTVQSPKPPPERCPTPRIVYLRAESTGCGATGDDNGLCETAALVSDATPTHSLISHASILGAALCTNNTVQPIYVSIGHKISLQAAINIVIQCCQYRIPEPLRRANIRSRAKAKDLTLDMSDT